jgi:hypothetical protein
LKYLCTLSMHILCREMKNCILGVVRHAYHTRVNESFSKFFMKTRSSPLIPCLEILNRYCRLTYESPLAKKRSVSANLSWTEMAFSILFLQSY